MKKFKISIIIGCCLMLVGFIIQAIVMYNKIGTIILLAFMPHWSLLFYLGLIPICWGIIGEIFND